jgi:hypothetical protein
MRLVCLLIGLLLPLSGRPAVAASQGPPPGEARIWIYRVYEPYVSEATPYVRLNGAVVGISRPGGAFSCDVAPGTYRVTVDSEGRAADQFVPVAVVPGETVYVRIFVDNWWATINPNYSVDTFYTRLMPLPAALFDMAHVRLGGG